MLHIFEYIVKWKWNEYEMKWNENEINRQTNGAFLEERKVMYLQVKDTISWLKCKIEIEKYEMNKREGSDLTDQQISAPVY